MTWLHLFRDVFSKQKCMFFNKRDRTASLQASLLHQQRPADKDVAIQWQGCCHSTNGSRVGRVVGDTTFGLSLLLRKLPLAGFHWEVKPTSVEIQEAVLKGRTLLPNGQPCHDRHPTACHSHLAVTCPRGSILLHIPISTLYGPSVGLLPPTQQK